MITNLNASYDNGTFYLKADALCGVSADTKPTNVGNGSIFREIDTGKVYMYDAGGQTWYEQPAPGGGGGDEDNGVFMVNVTIDSTTHIPAADKTLAEVSAAHQAGKLIVVGVVVSSLYEQSVPSLDIADDEVIGVYWQLSEVAGLSSDPPAPQLDVLAFEWYIDDDAEVIETHEYTYDFPTEP